MRSIVLAALGLFACSAVAPRPLAVPTCSDRRDEILAEDWRQEQTQTEDGPDLSFTKPHEGTVYHRAVRCEAGFVQVDAEWAIFETQEEAQHHYDRRFESLANSCSTAIVEPDGFPEAPRTPKPLSSTTYFSSAVSYLAMVGCLEPHEKRILSLSRSDSHGVTSEPETNWSIEFNRQPVP